MLHYNCCFRKTKRKKDPQFQQTHLQPRLALKSCETSRPDASKEITRILCHLVRLVGRKTEALQKSPGYLRKSKYP